MYDEILDDIEEFRKSISPNKKFIFGVLWLSLGFWEFYDGIGLLLMYINNAWGLFPSYKAPIEIAYLSLTKGILAFVIAFVILIKPKFGIRTITIFLGIITLSYLYILTLRGLGIIPLLFIIVYFYKSNALLLFMLTSGIYETIEFINYFPPKLYYLTSIPIIEFVLPFFTIIQIKRRSILKEKLHWKWKVFILIIYSLHFILGYIFPF